MFVNLGGKMLQSYGCSKENLQSSLNLQWKFRRPNYNLLILHNNIPTLFYIWGFFRNNSAGKMKVICDFEVGEATVRLKLTTFAVSASWWCFNFILLPKKWVQKSWLCFGNQIHLISVVPDKTSVKFWIQTIGKSVLLFVMLDILFQWNFLKWMLVSKKDNDSWIH